MANTIGIVVVTLEDDAFTFDTPSLNRSEIPVNYRIDFVEGDRVRDWHIDDPVVAIFPYSSKYEKCELQAQVGHQLWPYRKGLESRLMFKKSQISRGYTWYEYGMLIWSKFRTPLSIVFGEVATHNHFVLDRGGKVFKQTAPVIKLPADATEDDHLALLGLLNSSTACFWLKQACFPKGGDHVGNEGARVRRTAWDERFAFNATNVEQFPLPTDRPLELARRLDWTATAYACNLPNQVCQKCIPDELTLAGAWQFASDYRGEMIALQEELDWQCYGLYGLISEEEAADCIFSERKQRLPAVGLGQRAFEIVLARQIAAGEADTTWFTRHESTPITEIPKHWPDEYRAIVQKRIDLIENDKNISLIEKPEYKRRWNTESWEDQQERALRSWLLDRLESYFDLDGRMNDAKEITARPELAEPQLTSVAQVADMARTDKEFKSVAEIYTDRPDFNIAALVAELITAESVPALPILRYKPAALDKRRAWERTWELQREEDRLTAQIDALTAKWKEAETARKPTTDIRAHIDKLKSQLPDIPIPPKYTSADFINSNHWRLRGKLDVPKERWISFPHCDGEDGTLPIAWAGYDHLQQATAIAGRYELAKENEGRKLVPLLTAIGGLIPWLKQWHNELDPAFGTRMGDYFESYLAQEAKALGMNVDEVMAWTPPAKAPKTAPKKVSTGRRGFPGSNRDVLLVTGGLSLIGPNGIDESLHLNSLLFMATPAACRTLISKPESLTSVMNGIDPELWSQTGVKWKQVRELLLQAEAIDIDPHSGFIIRKEPGFSKLRAKFGTSLDMLALIVLEAACSMQNATSAIQNKHSRARERELGVA